MANFTANKNDLEKKDDKSTVGHVASQVKDKAQEVASSVADKARDMGTSAVKSADSAAATVGGKMHSLADTVKQHGPNKGMMGTASTAVADTLDQAGRYLEQQGLSGAAEDMTNLIRKHPVPAVLIGLGLGFLLARVTSRS